MGVGKCFRSHFVRFYLAALSKMIVFSHRRGKLARGCFCAKFLGQRIEGGKVAGGNGF